MIFWAFLSKCQSSPNLKGVPVVIVRMATGTAAFTVTLVNQLRDNYAYILVDTASGEAAVVDCSEADQVVAALGTIGDISRVAYILTTHHHQDHCGGNEALVEAIKAGIEGVATADPLVEVVGGDDRIDALTRSVADGDVLALGDGTKVTVEAVPCHTTGHVLYTATADGQDPALFCGDTLFQVCDVAF